MFKKLKDKLAEEVKSSPQRIQQFAQAAQAAVTSASSSISDITNSDLFSIGDNDGQQRPDKNQVPNNHQNTFQDVSLIQSESVPIRNESMDYISSHNDSQRQRRLSNSSFASDLSFRLPSYESPSMYHLQSDMEISASEAEERGFSSGTVSLDRVTKEQLYAAYRRTQERYAKYRTQYADLARHYKILERENAKARSVLVETQDKALRRISELREQCTLEQSAKAHLEKALRVEIEDKNLKIDTLNTKIKLLQSNDELNNDDHSKEDKIVKEALNENDAQLIDLSNDSEKTQTVSLSEVTILNNKIEKLEQLLNKYKDSLKASKEKNAQMTTEIQILSNELGNKNKECEQLKATATHLSEAKQKIQELNEINEELQNKVNAFDFTKTKEMSTLEIDLQKAQEEIAHLQGKIEVFIKREEEYAISLAENKLSIHKELESKEAEIKSLKDTLSANKKEIQSLNIVINDYKNNITLLEEERSKLNNDINELNSTEIKITEMETQIQELKQKCQSLEHSKTKADEEYKCLQLQLKQETAEKLAMIDRNDYLENRNLHLSEENGKKSSQISSIESELQILKKEKEKYNMLVSEEYPEKNKMVEEIGIWKVKYSNLEAEIQEEREELVKLQSEIEKLLTNHELIQTQNTEMHVIISQLKTENEKLQQQVSNRNKINITCEKLTSKIKDLKQYISLTSEETKSLKNINIEIMNEFKENMNNIIEQFSQMEKLGNIKELYETLKNEYSLSQEELKKVMQQYFTASEAIVALQKENNSLNSNIQETKAKHSSELNSFKKENNVLNLKLKDTESENYSLQEKIRNIKNEYDDNLSKLNLLEKENQNLLTKVLSTENKFEHLQTTVNQNNKQYLNVTEKNEKLENENKYLLEKLKDIESKNELINAELDKSKVQQKEITSELNIKINDHNELLKEMERNKCYIDNLEESNKFLLQENISLKDQSQNIANSVKNLESEIREVRQSHALMEMEKDHLNTIIEKLENKEHKNELLSSGNDIETQTDDSIHTYQQQLYSVCEENNILKEKCEQFKQEKENLHEKCIALERAIKNKDQSLLTNISLLDARHADIEQEVKLVKESLHKSVQSKLRNEGELHTVSDMKCVDEILGKYNTLKIEYNLLKEDNRRLQSDVEGLQTYLTKISKENSILNDRLRELIASSENSLDKTETPSYETTDLKNEIQVEKEKLQDLLRENTLLIEENLELKDQLESQNYIKSRETIQRNGNDDELALMKEKYNNLLDMKNKLDKKLIDLESLNKSDNRNLQQMQEKNEKLRVSNEKLERRLDEALVSLSHLHSIQENTELEYLRNILYEYLTGSGTHSITLAKVLSAVVKFDDNQTQMVLQKEKERQGLLRQLGLI